MTGYNKNRATAVDILMHSDVPFGVGEPMLWYQLILEAERFRANTGYGLANVWGHIKAGEYDEARATMDALLGDELELTMNAIAIYERPRPD